MSQMARRAATTASTIRPLPRPPAESALRSLSWLRFRSSSRSGGRDGLGCWGPDPHGPPPPSQPPVLLFQGIDPPSPVHAPARAATYRQASRAQQRRTPRSSPARLTWGARAFVSTPAVVDDEGRPGRIALRFRQRLPRDFDPIRRVDLGEIGVALEAA